MVLCDIMISRKRREERPMCWYMLHLVALRDTDLSLCPPRWMNITLWAKITLQWSLRALCKPSQACPMDIREACLWVRDMRLRWWQNRWPPMVTRRADGPANIACYLSPHRYKQKHPTAWNSEAAGNEHCKVRHNIQILQIFCDVFLFFVCSYVTSYFDFEDLGTKST